LRLLCLKQIAIHLFEDQFGEQDNEVFDDNIGHRSSLLDALEFLPDDLSESLLVWCIFYCSWS
jgi:hypothetical protein